MESDWDAVLKKRLENINKMKDFVNDVDVRVKNIVGELNWDYKKLCSDKNDAVFCSVDPHHRISKSSVKEHEERCKWLREGYELDDKPFSEFSDNGFCTVISPELQTQIITVAASKTDKFELGDNNKVDRAVPKTSNRLEQDFTRDERLAIYDYAVANTQRKGSFSDFTFLSPEEKKEKKKEMEQWEIAAAERDAKRRRASYRNKVHTNKKTHTEILREVIESQMECLKEEIIPKIHDREEEKKYKKHDDRSSHKHSNRYDNGREDPHRHKKSHHHHHREKHKKSHKKRDRSTSRSRSKKHKKSVSRSRSREKHRKSSSKPYE